MVPTHDVDVFRLLSIAAALPLVVACVSPSHDSADQSPSTDAYTVGFWNVENLFDAEDDPANTGDDEYLPAAGWTEDRYRQKLDHIASVIAAVSPHVLGVCEVENRRVLEDLCAHGSLASLGYAIAHLDSPDKRGIDLALLCRAPFTVKSCELHRVEKEGQRPTRGVLEVGLEADGVPMTVLVNHWPSRGGDRDGSFRSVAGDVARGIVDRIGHDQDVIVLGDLNDDPFDRSVRDHLGAIRSRNAVLNRRNQAALWNASWSLFGSPDVGTLYYNREWRWNVFDQVIVSKGMLDENGFTWVDGSFSVHGPDEIRDEYRRPLRYRRNRDGSWREGYSDHFLVYGRVVLAR